MPRLCPTLAEIGQTRRSVGRWVLSCARMHACHSKRHTHRERERYAARARTVSLTHSLILCTTYRKKERMREKRFLAVKSVSQSSQSSPGGVFRLIHHATNWQLPTLYILLILSVMYQNPSRAAPHHHHPLGYPHHQLQHQRHQNGFLVDIRDPIVQLVRYAAKKPQFFAYPTNESHSWKLQRKSILQLLLCREPQLLLPSSRQQLAIFSHRASTSSLTSKQSARLDGVSAGGGGGHIGGSLRLYVLDGWLCVCAEWNVELAIKLIHPPIHLSIHAAERACLFSPVPLFIISAYSRVRLSHSALIRIPRIKDSVHFRTLTVWIFAEFAAVGWKRCKSLIHMRAKRNYESTAELNHAIKWRTRFTFFSLPLFFFLSFFLSLSSLLFFSFPFHST